MSISCRTRLATFGLTILSCVVPFRGTAQAQSKDSLDVLDRFSNSVQALTEKAAPSVAHILVNQLGPRDSSAGSRMGAVVGRQQSIGSGAVVSADGYILTNAHVVANAEKIRVSLLKDSDHSVASVLAEPFATLMDARLVGVFKEADLALIKVDAVGLRALRFADYTKVRQGQVVFAFGSPEGLRNSVSMGVVSSLARQPDPDSPFIYLQTDAPINPGNSGGPLVNTAGEIVGLTTFILTQSGGNESIGFAIPSPLLQVVYEQLRKYGHMHRLLMGTGVQAVTPTLAGALKLPKSSGVLVSDINPEGPADIAGLKLNDIVIAVDGKPVDNLPMFLMELLQHSSTMKVRLQVLRGTEKVSLEVDAEAENHAADHLAELIEPEKSLIRKLGIFAIGIDKRSEAMVGDLRRPSGVIVAALAPEPDRNAPSLQAGDVIHEVNGLLVTSVDALRTAIGKIPPGGAVALLIEREGKLSYVGFEIE